MVVGHPGGGKVWRWGALVVVGRSGGWMLLWWWDILVVGHSRGGGKLVVGRFHGGCHIAQRLCPDNVRLLAWGQTGINLPVASFLLRRLARCLGFPGDADVRNLRTC